MVDYSVTQNSVKRRT